MDAAVMPALARLGLTVLSPDLRQRVEGLDDADESLAAVVRADVERMAALLAPRLSLGLPCAGLHSLADTRVSPGAGSCFLLASPLPCGQNCGIIGGVSKQRERRAR